MPADETLLETEVSTDTPNACESVEYDIELSAQDAGMLVDLIGLCKTPYDLVKYGKFTELLVPQVSKFIQEFDKIAKEFQKSTEALYNAYYVKEEITLENGEKDFKSVLKSGKNVEDFNNTIKGLQDEFEVKAKKLKLETKMYKIRDEHIWSFFHGLDLSLQDKRKDQNPELFTAQLYSVAKMLSDATKNN